MTDNEAQSSDSLILSWPKSVTYDIDHARLDAGSTGGGREATAAETRESTAATTYNGIPLDVLGDAQKLSGDEIRLLDLKKGTPGDPLLGSLRKVRISDSIVYEPLSYTWNDYDTAEASEDDNDDDVLPTLFLSDTQYYINLGSNCAKALSAVRKSVTERTIWVDSICVNQEDQEERSHQVDMMKRIYARSFTVLVYLGQRSLKDDSDMAMSLLDRPDRLQEFTMLDDNERSCLTRLFGRPYFQRIWIVQEVALAKTLELYCGAKKAYISAFAGKPLEKILDSGFAHPAWLNNSKYKAIRQHQPRVSSRAEQLLSLLIDTAECHCSDDRDRIFALFSLLDPTNEDQLTADYTLSTEEAYTGISAFLITNGLMWNVLMLATQPGHLVQPMPTRYPGLPSWAPDWSQLGNIKLKNLDVSDRSFVESRYLEPGVWFGISRAGVLTVRGMALGPVYPSDSGRYWTLSGRDRGWGCHFGFTRGCVRSSQEQQYLGVMLPDYSTLLILRRDEGLSDEYTLIQIGEPTVLTTSPGDWWESAGTTERKVSLPTLLTPLGLRSAQIQTVLSSPELLPRLSAYPGLWCYNPITSAMSLKYSTINHIRVADLRLGALWADWQQYAHRCIQTLRDKDRLQLLITDIMGFREKDWQQFQRWPWPLDYFLCLFIRGPDEKKSTVWSEFQSSDARPFNGQAALRDLSKWSSLTYDCLSVFQKGHIGGIREPLIARGQNLLSEALEVVSFHESIAHADCKTDGAKCYSIRHGSIFLLAQISRQHNEACNQDVEQGSSRRSDRERYWDWGEFLADGAERVSLLDYVLPDLEKIRSELEVQPDYEQYALWQVAAAHGIDAKNMGFTQIRIK